MSVSSYLRQYKTSSAVFYCDLRRIGITACKLILFCCLWSNVETFCHKHFVVVFGHQQTPPLTTSDKCRNLPRSGGTVLITPSRSQRPQHATKPYIGSESQFCLPNLHLTPTPLRKFPSEYCRDVWYGKTKMVWLPDGEESPLNVLHMVKKVKDIFIRFGRMYERDRRTDRRTDIA